MAGKDRGPCDVCGCALTTGGKSERHALCPTCGRSCRTAWLREYESRTKARFGTTGGSFEPQAVTSEAPGPLGRPFEDPRNNQRFNEMRQRGEFLNPVRVAVFDIETSGLNAGFGVVLCAVIKMYGPDERKVFRADEYGPWRRGERANDEPLLRDILSTLEDCDILVAHNGLRFDMPFLRTRAVVHNLPPVTFQKIIDPVQLARQHFRFSGNSLDSIAKVIGTRTEKTPVRPETWQRATLNGDAAAMQEIVDHCIADVEVLEEICWKVRGYVKQIDRAGSYR